MNIQDKRPFLISLIEDHWQQPRLWLSLLLTPLSWLFALISWLRRFLYHHWLKITHHPVPIIVVGNIHAGGTGKTPIVIAIVQKLQEKGIKVAVISHGFARKQNTIRLLANQDQVQDVGDEPLLIMQRTGAPVCVGKKRNLAIKTLLQKYPDLDCIISDDGLQYYAMARDIELIVFPISDIGKTLKQLPQGPLREPMSRLYHDQVRCVISQTTHTPLKKPSVKTLGKHAHIFYATLKLGPIYPLNAPTHFITPDFFQSKSGLAACAISKGQRFFSSLHELGIVPKEKMIQTDHSILPLPSLASRYDYVIITEKDAVKFREVKFNNVFVLSYRADIEESLINDLLSTVKAFHG